MTIIRTMCDYRQSGYGRVRCGHAENLANGSRRTVFHVLNHGVGRMRPFLKHADFEALERTIEKTLETRPMRICAYCLLSNY